MKIAQDTPAIQTVQIVNGDAMRQSGSVNFSRNRNKTLHNEVSVIQIQPFIRTSPKTPYELKELFAQDYKTSLKSWALQQIRLKRWLYLGINSPDMFLGLALIDAAYFKNMFCYYYQKNGNQLLQTEAIALSQKEIDVPYSSIDAEGSFKKRDQYIRIQIEPNGIIRLAFSLFLEKQVLTGDVKMSNNYNDIDQLALLTRFKNRSPVYTTKTTQIPTEGFIKFNGNRNELTPDLTLSMLDFSIGYYPYHTFWNWASASGKTSNGLNVGFTMSNYTPPGQTSDKNPNSVDLDFLKELAGFPFHENGFWLNGKLTKIRPVQFAYRPEKILDEWHIQSDDGQLKLTFAPIAERQGNINLLAIRSKFHQPFGYFSGQIQSEGKTLELDKIFGVVEEHYATW